MAEEERKYIPAENLAGPVVREVQESGSRKFSVAALVQKQPWHDQQGKIRETIKLRVSVSKVDRFGRSIPDEKMEMAVPVAVAPALFALVRDSCKEYEKKYGPIEVPVA